MMTTITIVISGTGSTTFHLIPRPPRRCFCASSACAREACIASAGEGASESSVAALSGEEGSVIADAYARGSCSWIMFLAYVFGLRACVGFFVGFFVRVSFFYTRVAGVGVVSNLNLSLLNLSFGIVDLARWNWVCRNRAIRRDRRAEKAFGKSWGQELGVRAGGSIRQPLRNLHGFVEGVRCGGVWGEREGCGGLCDLPHSTLRVWQRDTENILGLF